MSNPSVRFVAATAAAKWPLYPVLFQVGSVFRKDSVPSKLKL